MSDPTLDPETRALVDALLRRIDSMDELYNSIPRDGRQSLRDGVYRARDALRAHLRPKPLTVEAWTREWFKAEGVPLNHRQMLDYHRDIEAAIARGEVVDDE